MTKQIKNTLGVAGIIALIAVAYAVVSYSSSFAIQSEISSPSFRVSGEGKVVIVPNIATFSFGVTTEGGKDIAKLQNENTKKMNSIIEIVKSNGVDVKDIQTTNYSIQPKYQYYRCPPSPIKEGIIKTCPSPTITGYTIKQNVKVKIRDFSKAGNILSAVGQKGANSVSQLSFSVDNRTKFEDEARDKAIAQAKAKAKAIAKSSGFSIGKLVSFNENKSNYYPRPQYSVETKFVQQTPVKILPGTQDIKSSVTLQYLIK